jgi:hypothetical protein
VFQSSPLKSGLARLFVLNIPSNFGLWRKAVHENLDSFLSENNIRPEQMTPEQAKGFVERVIRSTDPRIRGYNLRIFMREFQYLLRRGPRREE